MNTLAISLGALKTLLQREKESFLPLKMLLAKIL